MSKKKKKRKSHITIHHKIYTQLVRSNECACVSSYALQLIAFSILNLTEKKEDKPQHTFQCQETEKQQIVAFHHGIDGTVMSLPCVCEELSFGATAEVWIREYQGNVSTISTRNITIICDGWSICSNACFRHGDLHACQMNKPQRVT